uniref:Uncharacterized protein n=1 Tax=Plectus sambesii TaxID=2011161 RepID=A0A914V1E9_9BILA
MPDFSVLLHNQFKPKPWRGKRQICEFSNAQRGRRLHLITRQLVAYAAPTKLHSAYVEQECKRRKVQRRPKINFLTRNLIASLRAFDDYQARLEKWVADHPPVFNPPDKVVYIDSSLDSANNTHESVEFSEDLSFSSTNNKSTPNSKNSPDNKTSPDEEGSALGDDENTPVRMFHTVWHVGRLGTKTIKTRDDAARALCSLAHSDTVNKSMKKPSKGPDALFDAAGRPLPLEHEQRKVLTPKVQLCLSRWSRLMHYTADWTPGDVSGEEDDVIDTWNSMVRNTSISSEPKTPVQPSSTKRHSSSVVSVDRPKLPHPRRSPRLPSLNATR